MLFNSYAFLLYFLPVVLIGYYTLGHQVRPTAAKIWLCAASLVFYGWIFPPFVVLLVVSIAANYAISVFILSTAERPERQRWLLTLGVALNLGALIYYKYLFTVLSFLHGQGLIAGDFGRIALPLGISFFTFTQIGYLVDCQQDLVRERGLLNYILFVTFFPHLIAGPILHNREIMPQFADDATYRLNERNLAVGATTFVFGLFKKVLLADSIAPWAQAGFDHPGALGTLSAWSTMLAYSMQLYFDFSGYSDMAIGLGIMFGVRLPLNFNSPYKAASVIDFWQRWHMTLTRYLGLLLYNPISLWMTRRRAAQGKPANRRAAEKPDGFFDLIVIPTGTTMFLAGIWHGAGAQFIVFGVLHAVYLIVNHAWRIFGPRGPKTGKLALLDHAWKAVLTYLCVLVAQVFFRADNVASAVAMLEGAFGAHGSELPLPVRGGRITELGRVGDLLYQHGILAPGRADLFLTVTRPLVDNSALVLLLMGIVWATPNIYQILGDWSPALQKVPAIRWRRLHWQPSLAWSVCAGVMLFYALTRLDHPGRFLYFQF